MENEHSNIDVINKDMETIFDMLDEKNMSRERESLTFIINNYNSKIDNTMNALENIITSSENMTLKITDILFAFLGAYAVYCFSAHNDFFGNLLAFSIFLIWAGRDVIVKTLTGTSRE